MNKLKFGVIGFGYWGPNHCRVINNDASSKLVAICEKDETKLNQAGKLYPNIALHANSQPIFKDNDIDAVVIATPAITHVDLIIEALENDKHVLCEKPLAISTEEISKIERIATAHNKILMCAQIFEFNSIVRYLKTYLSNNDIGKYLYITANRSGLGPIRSDVNVIYDLATHDISIIIYLLDKMPLYVSAMGSSCFGNDKEDIAFINLEFDDAFFVSIQVSWLDPIKKREIKVVGSKKMLLFNDVSVDEKLKIIETGKSYLSFSGDFGSFQSKITDGDIIIPNITYNEPLKTQFSHFLECIEKNEVPQTDLQNAKRVITVLEALNKSIKNNGKRIEIE